GHWPGYNAGTGRPRAETVALLTNLSFRANPSIGYRSARVPLVRVRSMKPLQRRAFRYVPETRTRETRALRYAGLPSFPAALNASFDPVTARLSDDLKESRRA